MNDQSAKVWLLGTATALSLLLTPQASFATTEIIDPNVFGEVTIDSSGWNLASPVFSLDVIQDPNNNLEKRSFLEYSLATLSADTVITSATLELSVTFAGQGAIPIDGYAGNGIAELGDAIRLPNSEIGASEVITTNSSLVNVPLDVGFVQNLIGSGSHLGILLFGTANTMETTFGSLGVPPAKLIVTTSAAGDFNFDGIVNAFDFLAWQRGESPNPFSASDLATWESAYSTPIVGAAAAVPEPATMWLFAFGALLPIRSLRLRRGITR